MILNNKLVVNIENIVLFLIKTCFRDTFECKIVAPV